MALSALGQAFGALFVKFAAHRGMQCFQILFFRGMMMWAANTSVLKSKGVPFRNWWGAGMEHTCWLTFRGLFGFLSLACKYWSVIHLYLADAISLRFTVHIFSGIFACILLGESWLIGEAISAVVGFGGILMVVQPAWLSILGFPAKVGPAYPIFDVTVAILCPVFNALGYVAIRKLKKIKDDTDPFIILHFLGMFLTFASLPLARIIEGPLELPDNWQAWFWLLALSATTYISQVFVTWGLQLERAGPGTTVTLIGVPATMVLQVVFLRKNEPLSILSCIGALVICLSIGNVALGKRSAKKEELEVLLGDNAEKGAKGHTNGHSNGHSNGYSNGHYMNGNGNGHAHYSRMKDV